MEKSSRKTQQKNINVINLKNINVIDSKNVEERLKQKLTDAQLPKDTTQTAEKTELRPEEVQQTVHQRTEPFVQQATPQNIAKDTPNSFVTEQFTQQATPHDVARGASYSSKGTLPHSFVNDVLLNKEFRKFLSYLGAALIFLSSFAEKQTQKEPLEDAQAKKAIVQLGALGMTLVRLELNNGNEASDFKLKTPLSELDKEVMHTLLRDLRIYDDDMNKTPAEKDKAEGRVRFDTSEENPFKNFELRRDALKKGRD